MKREAEAQNTGKAGRPGGRAQDEGWNKIQERCKLGKAKDGSCLSVCRRTKNTKSNTIVMRKNSQLTVSAPS